MPWLDVNLQHLTLELLVSSSVNFPLRDYQELAIQMLREAVANGCNKPLLHLATAGGKGLIMSSIVYSAISKNKKILVVMRRRNLIIQTCENFLKYHRIVASPLMGNTKGYDPKNPVQVCSIDTLRARMNNPAFHFLKEYDIVQIDESHDINAPTYQEFVKWMGDKLFIGLTASPYAMQGKPLKFWERALKPITNAALRDQGYLAPCKIFAPVEIDTKGLKILAGEFNQKDLNERASESKIVGDIVETYIKYGENKPGLIFAVNKEHSRLLTTAFNSAGIPTVHIDDSTKDKDRKNAIADLNSGKIKLISSIGVLTTGTDIPIATVGIMARPTMSLVLWIQMVGRLLRIHPTKDYAIILDHGGNTYRHGGPYEDHDAELEIDQGKKAKSSSDEKEMQISKCPKCSNVMMGRVSVCSNCGGAISSADRKINEEEGELVEINPEDVAFKSNMLRTKIIKRHKQLLNIATLNCWKQWAVEFRLYKEFKDDIFLAIPAFPLWVKNRSDQSEGK